MGNKSNPTLGIGLACLLLLCGALWSPAEAGKGSTTVSGQTGQTGQIGQMGQVSGATGQAAPVVTTSLVVNGAAAACGATVMTGSQVCLQLTSNETGTAVVTLQNENGTSAGATASGSVTAGTTYNVCATAGAADGQTRVFTVTVTNGSGQSFSQQCSYVVP